RELQPEPLLRLLQAAQKEYNRFWSLGITIGLTLSGLLVVWLTVTSKDFKSSVEQIYLWLIGILGTVGFLAGKRAYRKLLLMTQEQTDPHFLGPLLDQMTVQNQGLMFPEQLRIPLRRMLLQVRADH